MQPNKIKDSFGEGNCATRSVWTLVWVQRAHKNLQEKFSSIMMLLKKFQAKKKTWSLLHFQIVMGMFLSWFCRYDMVRSSKWHWFLILKFWSWFLKLFLILILKKVKLLLILNLKREHDSSWYWFWENVLKFLILNIDLEFFTVNLNFWYWFWLSVF